MRDATDLRSFLEIPYVPVGPVTADRYSRIVAFLRAKRVPFRAADVWIVAHAMESGADLVSAGRHFKQVHGLAWIRAEAG